MVAKYTPTLASLGSSLTTAQFSSNKANLSTPNTSSHARTNAEKNLLTFVSRPLRPDVLEYRLQPLTQNYATRWCASSTSISWRCKVQVDSALLLNIWMNTMRTFRKQENNSDKQPWLIDETVIAKKAILRLPSKSRLKSRACLLRTSISALLMSSSKA